MARTSSNQNRRNQSEWPQPEPPSLSSAPDRLLKKLEQVRSIITENPQSVRDSERATEMFCVLPIVSGLGWDVESPQDIVPQQRITEGRGRADRKVDFAMQIEGIPVVLVEVKRHSDYYKREWDEQLRRYTDYGYMKSGYGALTNGQKWMIYTVDGGQTTHIHTVDIVEDREEAATRLHEYLSKEALVASPPTQASQPSTQSSWPTPIDKGEIEEYWNEPEIILPEYGFCIRCGTEIPCAMDRPYCNPHYRSWARFKNENYEEDYCHICGNENDTSMAKPLCLSCFRKYRSAFRTAS